jgi:hypothetical protein
MEDYLVEVIIDAIRSKYFDIARRLLKEVETTFSQHDKYLRILSRYKTFIDKKVK